MRMVALILLLNASSRALEWSGRMVLRMSSRRLRIFLHSSTIPGMREWLAQLIHRLSSPSAWPASWCRSVRRSSLSCQERGRAGPWDPRRRAWRGPWIGARSSRRGFRARRIPGPSSPPRPSCPSLAWPGSTTVSRPGPGSRSSGRRCGMSLFMFNGFKTG